MHPGKRHLDPSYPYYNDSQKALRWFNGEMRFFFGTPISRSPAAPDIYVIHRRIIYSVLTRRTENIIAIDVLANMNSRSRSPYARPFVVRLSSVCNVRASYSAGWNFRQCLYAIWYLGHPLTSTKNFTEIVPGEPLCRGREWLNARTVAKYSDFGPIDNRRLYLGNDAR